MLLHLPRRAVAAASVLILRDSWEQSALPAAQLCEREDSSVLSGDQVAFKGPPSHRRATPLGNHSQAEGEYIRRNFLYERVLLCDSLLFQKPLADSWTTLEATPLKPFDLEHLGPYLVIQCFNKCLLYAN